MESPAFLKFASILVEVICCDGGFLISFAQAELEQTSLTEMEGQLQGIKPAGMRVLWDPPIRL